MAESSLTHLNAQGQAQMVDVSAKGATVREAIAISRVTMQPETLAAIAALKMTEVEELVTARMEVIVEA